MSRFVWLAVVVGVLGWGQVAEAASITWNFSGTMDDTGEPFAGFVSFDSQATDISPTTPLRGDYRFFDLSEGNFEATLNGDFVFADPVHADGRVPDYVGEAFVSDDQDAMGDLIRFGFNVLITPPPAISGLQEFQLVLYFVDETGTWFSGDLLPTGPISLASLMLDPTIDGWGDSFALTAPAVLSLRTVTSGNDSVRFGTIESLSAVPEPATLLLLGTGLLGAGVMARRRRKQ